MIPCEVILTSLTEKIDEDALRSRENIMVVVDENCFVVRKNDLIRAECREAYRVYFVVKPGMVLREGGLVGFTYSSRGVIRKIKAKFRGLIVAIIHDPNTKPERGCAIFHPLEGTPG